MLTVPLTCKWMLKLLESEHKARSAKHRRRGTFVWHGDDPALNPKGFAFAFFFEETEQEKDLLFRIPNQIDASNLVLRGTTGLEMGPTYYEYSKISRVIIA